MQPSPIIIRTDSFNNDFQKLVSLLDEELRILDGEEQRFLAQLNATFFLKQVVVVYENKLPVGCGALREYIAGVMEIKRMYVVPEKRRSGIASAVLSNLERWCAELGVDKCILETGKNQPEAIAMYEKNGYKMIPNFGKYTGVENSICFEKELIL